MNHWSKTALIVLALVASVGCWQEVHFDPAAEPPVQTPAVLVSSNESTPQHSDNQAASTTTSRATEPDQPTAEAPEPAWDDSPSAAEFVTSAKPTPPADLNWLEDEPTIEPVETRPTVPRAAAWQLGSKWSLAIGIYGKGYGADRYSSVADKAKQAAEQLDVPAPSIPSSAESPLTTAIDVLRSSKGPQLVEAIGRSHSPQHESLCQLAIVTHALLLDYSPEDEDLGRTVEDISQLASSAELPSELWQPVIDALNNRAEFQDVKETVLKLHRETSKYLSNMQ